MRSVVCRHSELHVVDGDALTPGKGQLLLDVTRCGICGSDLHARTQSDAVADVVSVTGYEDFMRSGDAVVMGHEFVGEVVGIGPKPIGRIKEGTPVVALPMIKHGGEVHLTGLSAKAPGGYAEQLLVEESLALPVPNGLAPDIAVLTEPMAVGLHAVARSEIGKRDVAVVVGCGPVGLAVILLLKARGVRHVIASDLSPGRRALATACGADEVVDPAQASPFASAEQHGHLVSTPATLSLAVGTIEKVSRLKLPWWHVWRAAEKVGAATPKAPVVFECVGVPGMIDAVITGAPLYSRVVVVGVCMGSDQLRPALAINKEIDLRFVFGYTPLEFRDMLHMLADGEVDPRPMVTGSVGLDGVAGAFEALGDPEAHAKILVDPSRAGTEIAAA